MWRQLRERRLVRTVFSYAAAGWIVLEVVDQLADRGVLPDLAYHLVLVAYLAGMCATVVIGWYHGERGAQKVVRSEVVLLALIGVVGLGTAGWVVQRGLRSEPSGVAMLGGTGLDPTRIAVLYFADASRHQSLAHLADGLTETLIDELSAVSNLSVVSRDGSLPFRDSDVPRDSIARALRAGTLVTGAVEDVGPEIRVSVALSDGTSGAEFRRTTFQRPAPELFQLQDSLARGVAELLRAWLGEEVSLQQAGRETDDVAAWALYQRAERARKSGEAALSTGDPESVAIEFALADSLLADAEALDPRWARPPVLQAQIAIRRAQIEARDPPAAGAWVARGFDHVAQALALDGKYAPAYQARGTLSYLKWGLGLATDPAEAGTLLSRAQEDLQSAVRLDATLANAWYMLSIVYSQKPDLVEAKLAAQRAYEEDAFLRGAENVLWSLYATSYDLEQFQDALQYCQEGKRRFPGSARIAQCELFLLATRALPPDVDRAWRVLDHMDELTPPQQREFSHLRGRMVVGGVLARAGMLDSAEAVWRSSEGDPEVDPAQELLGFEAVFRLQAGQKEEALRLLKSYLTTSPEHRAGWQWSAHWWWRDLQDDPEYQQLMGTGS